jgi:hypothetical protein
MVIDSIDQLPLPEVKKKKGRKVVRLLSTLPTIPNPVELSRYIGWYVTTKGEPEDILYEFLDRDSSAGKNGAVVALHVHTAHNGRHGRIIPGDEDFEDLLGKYGTGSDGAATLDEVLLHASSDTTTNILCVTDHATPRDIVTGELLSHEALLPYGVGLGAGAVERWKELREEGKLRDNLYVLGGAELDINGTHVVAINLKYDDLSPLFRKEIGNDIDSSLPLVEKHRQFCNYLDKVGFKKVIKHLKGIDTVVVGTPHAYTPISGAGGRKLAAGDFTEEGNGEALALLAIPKELLREEGFEKAYPAALYAGAMPIIEAARVREGKSKNKTAWAFSPDSHSLATIDLYQTVFPGIGESDFSAENPQDILARRMKAELREGNIYGGVNPRYLGEDGRAKKEELGEIAREYYGLHLEKTLREWGRPAMRVVGPLAQLPYTLRKFYQEKIVPRYGEGAGKTLGRFLGLPKETEYSAPRMR